MLNCYKSVEQLIISQKQNSNYSDLKSSVDSWLVDNLKSNKINQTTAKTLSDMILEIYVNSELDYEDNLSQLYNQLLNAKAKGIQDHVMDKVEGLLNPELLTKLSESITDKNELTQYIEDFKNTAVKLALKEYVNAMILPDAINLLNDDQIATIYSAYVNDDLDSDKIRNVIKDNIYDYSKLDSISKSVNGLISTVSLDTIQNYTDSMKSKALVNANELQADAITQLIAKPISSYDDLESNFKITDLKAKLATTKSQLLDLEDQLENGEITDDEFQNQSKILLADISSLQDSIKSAYETVQNLTKLSSNISDPISANLANKSVNLMLNQPNEPVCNLSNYLQKIAEVNSDLSKLLQVQDYLSTVKPTTPVDDIANQVQDLGVKLLNLNIDGFSKDLLTENLNVAHTQSKNKYTLNSYKFIQKFCALYDIPDTITFENKLKTQVLDVDLFNKTSMSYQKASEIITKSIKLGNKDPKDFTFDQIKDGVNLLKDSFGLELLNFNTTAMNKSLKETTADIIKNIISKDSLSDVSSITPTNVKLDVDSIIRSNDITNSIVTSLKFNPKYSNVDVAVTKKNYSELLLLSVISDFVNSINNKPFTIDQLLKFAKLKYPKLAPSLDSYLAATTNFTHDQTIKLKDLLDKLQEVSDLAKVVLSLTDALLNSDSTNIQTLTSAIQVSKNSGIKVSDLTNEISLKSNNFIQEESIEAEQKLSFDAAMKKAKNSLQAQFTASTLGLDLPDVPHDFLNLEETDQQVYAIRNLPDLNKPVVKADGQIGILINKELIVADVNKDDTTQDVIDKLQSAYSDKLNTTDKIFAIVSNNLLIKSQFSFKNPTINIVKSNDPKQIYILDMPTRSGLVKLTDSSEIPVVIDDLPIKLVDQTLIKLSNVSTTPATIELKIGDQTFSKTYNSVISKDMIANDIKSSIKGVTVNSNNDIVALNISSTDINVTSSGLDDIAVKDLPPKSAMTTNLKTETESTDVVDLNQSLSAGSTLTIILNGTPVTITLTEDTPVAEAFDQLNDAVAELGLNTTVKLNGSGNIVVNSDDGVVDVEATTTDSNVAIPEIPKPKPVKPESEPESTQPGKSPTPDKPKPSSHHKSFGEVVSDSLKDAGDKITHVIDSVSFSDLNLPPTTKVNRKTGEVSIQTPSPWLNNTVNSVLATPKIQHAIRDYFNVEDKLLNPPNIPPIDMKELFTADNGAFEEMQYQALLASSGITEAMVPPAGYTDDLAMLTALQEMDMSTYGFKDAMTSEINKRLPSGWSYKNGVFAYNKTFDLTNIPAVKKLQKLMDMNLNDIAQKYLDAYLTKYTMMMYIKMLQMMNKYLSQLKPVFSLLGRLSALMDAVMPGSTSSGINFCNLGGFSWPGLFISIDVLLPLMNFHWPTLDLDALWKAFLKAVLMALSNLKEIIKSALKMILRTLTLLLKMAKSVIVKAYKAIVKSLGMDACFVIQTVIQLIKIVRVCMKIIREVKAFRDSVKHPG